MKTYQITTTNLAGGAPIVHNYKGRNKEEAIRNYQFINGVHDEDGIEDIKELPKKSLLTGLRAIYLMFKGKK